MPPMTPDSTEPTAGPGGTGDASGTGSGQPLPPITSVAYYETGGIFVRADVTFLRQDFSVVQPVEMPAEWEMDPAAVLSRGPAHAQGIALSAPLRAGSARTVPVGAVYARNRPA